MSKRRRDSQEWEFISCGGTPTVLPEELCKKIISKRSKLIAWDVMLEQINAKARMKTMKIQGLDVPSYLLNWQQPRLRSTPCAAKLEILDAIREDMERWGQRVRKLKSDTPTGHP